MTKPKTTITNLPFPGFYHSNLSEAIELEESEFIDYHCQIGNGETDPDYENGYPEELRLNEAEYTSLLIDATNYQKAYEALSKCYVDSFDYFAGQALGLTAKSKRRVWRGGAFVTETWDRPSLGMTYESMDSPSEYNFTTDRVFAHIPLKVIRELFRRSKADNHETLAAVIEERFTDYPGFHSYYDNTLTDWLAKPVTDWDHNEVCTLIIAALRLSEDFDPDHFSLEVEDYTISDGQSYEAWSDAVDWAAFETARDKLRAEKALEAGIATDWRSGPAFPSADQQPLPLNGGRHPA